MTHPPNLLLRDVRAGDLNGILRLNNSAGPSILPLEPAALNWFYHHADYFRVAEVDGHLAGFLIAFGTHAPHVSQNFLWFRDHYDDFVYIDRVVIGNCYRGHGLGRVFYNDVQAYAEVRAPTLACEVFLEPHDHVSLLFHGTFGFQEVSQWVMPDSGRRVSLLVKPLLSYPFVQQHYPDGLPDLPWLAARILPIAEPEPQLRAAGQA
jgi:predicted GNAT superfamily acetyltransferase